MMERLKNWLRGRFSTPKPSPSDRSRNTGAYLSPRPPKPAAPKAAALPKAAEGLLLDRRSAIEDRRLEPDEIEDDDSEDKTLIRNKYIREDTGTHETLTILDDSLVDSGEEIGIDPYNTGGFDRSKNWNNRFRK